MAVMHVAPGRRYGALSYTDGRWYLSDLPPHVSIRFKHMFGQVSKTEAKHFVVADSPEVCRDLIWFMHRYPLQVEEVARRLLDRGHRKALEREAVADTVLSLDWKPTGTPAFRENRAPWPFQEQAAEIAGRLGVLLLMDDVGLGKTISALAAIAKSNALPAAIVVQAHLAEQWAEDYVEAFTTMSVHVIKGTKPYDLPPADIYIFRYSNYAGWVELGAEGFFKSVIFDEIQELRHGTVTVKGTAAVKFCQHAELKMGLTATPVFNYGAEIFNIVDILSPGALGTADEFDTEWCTYGSLVKDPVALGSYLRESSLAIRRTEDDVGKQMPKPNVLMHHVEYDEDVVAAVEAEARLLALKVLNGNFMVAGQAARELDMLARHATGVSKARSVAALVRMLAESGKHVLVGGWHRDVYDIWLKDLADLNPLMFTGTESKVQKRKAKQAFVSGDSLIMLMSLRSGAGLDGLQDVCHTVVIGELDWSPQVHKQLIGRVRRPGQKHQVDAIYAHTNGGSDPVLVEMLGLKSAQAQGIVDPFAPISQVESDDSRIRKLAQAYLEGGKA